jgi:hypothetical protein
MTTQKQRPRLPAKGLPVVLLAAVALVVGASSSSSAENPSPVARQPVAARIATAGVSRPFTQCPPVHLSPSCGILIVVNADRTVSVLGDPSVPPYDGGKTPDDTLIGVQNNSTAPVLALTVSGPSGGGLFNLFGDSPLRMASAIS